MIAGAQRSTLWQSSQIFDVLYMRRGFAGRAAAIMALSTITGYVEVVEGRRHPANRRVAVRAIVAALDMRQMLARGFDAVMAEHAFADDVDVTEVRWHPAICRMAIVTGIAGREVFRMLAGGRQAVVTVYAAADDLGVVDDENRRPGRDVVAVLANFRRLDVRHWLASRIRAIMALCAVIHDVQVIEGGGQATPPSYDIRSNCSRSEYASRVCRWTSLRYGS